MRLCSTAEALRVCMHACMVNRLCERSMTAHRGRSDTRSAGTLHACLPCNAREQRVLEIPQRASMQYPCSHPARGRHQREDHGNGTRLATVWILAGVFMCHGPLPTAAQTDACLSRIETASQHRPVFVVDGGSDFVEFRVPE